MSQVPDEPNAVQTDKTETQTALPTNGAKDAQAQTTKPKRSRSSRFWLWVRNSLRLVIYIPLLLLVLAALLIGTPFGSRVSVMLADKFVPGLDISYHSGTLNQEISVEHVHWQMPGIDVKTQRLSLNWDPLCLFNRQVCVNALDVAKVTVAIDTDAIPTGDATETNASDEPDTLLTLPISINLNRSELNDIKIRVNDMQFNSHRLELSALWPDAVIEVNHLYSDGLEVIIPLAADLADSTATETETATSTEAKQESKTAAQAKPEAKQPETSTDKQHPHKDDSPWALAHMPHLFIPVAVDVQDLRLDNSALRIGDRQDVFSVIELIASLRGTELSVDKLDAEHSYGKLCVNGHMSFTHTWPLNYQAHLTLNQGSFLADMPPLSADVAVKGDFSELNTDVSVTGELAANLRGQINLQQPELPFSLHGQKIDLHWPLVTPDYQIKSGAILVSGNLNSQLAAVSGFVDSPFSPTLVLAADMLHENEQLTIKQLSMLQELTSVHLKGELNYQQELTWKANLAIAGFNPASMTLPLSQPLPEGLLALNLDTQGLVDGDKWQASVTNTEVSGTLKQEQVSAMGNISIDNNLFIIADNFTIDALGSHLSLNGQLAKEWRLNAELDVPDMSKWSNDAAGKLHAKVDLTGTEAAPKLVASADLLNASYLSNSLAKLTLDFNAVLKQQRQYTLAIKGQTAKAGAMEISELNLNSQGNSKDQQTELDVKGTVDVDTKIITNFNEAKQYLTGQMTAFNATTPLGRWILDDPVNLNWSQTKMLGQFSPLCLKQANNQVCLSTESGVGARGDTQLSFSGAPGEVLKPLLPPGLEWQGLARLVANAAWSPNTKPKAQLVLQLPEGHLIVSRQNEQNVDVPYQKVEIAAELNQQQLTTRLQASAGQQMSIDSAIDIAVTPDRSLTGHLTIEHGDLSTWLPFIPQLAILKGEVTTQIAIGGSLAQPQLTGNVTINGGAIASNANPTLIEDVNFRVNFERQQASTFATWRMGHGAGRLDGDVDWTTGEPLGTINIHGEKLDVIAPPLAILQVSPQLVLEMKPSNLHLKGKVTIPSGAITIVQLAPGGVALSSDVVFNDSTSAEQQQSAPFPFSTDLNIQVEPNVAIQGLGLKGNLSGNLNLQQQVNRPPFLFGEVKVVNGSYRFLGQTLQINVGELQFTGPADVPNLNIEAIRAIKEENVTAGVRITGTAKKPVVTLFSNPPKEQAEILSYIIKGSGFSNGDDSNDALMMGAALALGNQLGGGAMSEIGNTATNLIEKFGFNNVQLDTNDDGQVAISGYIGEKLMVKYGVGVFNPGYELTVRYYLLSRLYLETVSGTLGQSLDIYYSFDF